MTCRANRILNLLLLTSVTATVASVLLANPPPDAESSHSGIIAVPEDQGSARRWHPGEEQHGINILFYAAPSTTESDTLGKADRTATYLARLNANAAAIAFPFYTDGPTAKTVHTGEATPSPQLVRAATVKLIRRGFRVTVRPLLDEKAVSGDGGWRGTVEPYDRAAWFASYQRLLEPYLDAAQQAGVTTFDLGSELESLETDPRWNDLTAWAATRFHGELVYAQNWGTWQSAGAHPDSTVAVDAYPPFPDLADTADLQQVELRWRRWLQDRPAPPTGTVLQEVGIAAQPGAYAQPYTAGLAGRPYEPLIQATWFTAACRAQRALGLGGIYYWGMDLNADPMAVPEPPAPTSFLHTAAEAAIQECFAP